MPKTPYFLSTHMPLKCGRRVLAQLKMSFRDGFKCGSKPSPIPPGFKNGFIEPFFGVL